jgi:hypothetical protein
LRDETGFYGVTDRVVIIVLILLTMPFALIIGYVASRRAKKKELKAKSRSRSESRRSSRGEAAPQKIAAPVGNYDDLNKAPKKSFNF